MIHTEALKKKLILLVEEINSNQDNNIKFNQQNKIKENMSFSGCNGRVWIKPFHEKYDICLSGKSIEKQMYKFMCDLCHKSHDGYKQTRPELRAPFWRVSGFEKIKKAIYHYAKTER